MAPSRGRTKANQKGNAYSSNVKAILTRLNKGVFENGTWLCNCTPRLPAQRFQVKKETKNKGRWFYTCQKSEENRCDFFLWEEEAAPRMEAAVLSNSTSEPGIQRTASPSKAQQQQHSMEMDLDEATQPGRPHSVNVTPQKRQRLVSRQNQDDLSTRDPGPISNGDSSNWSDSDGVNDALAAAADSTTPNVARKLDFNAPPPGNQAAQQSREQAGLLTPGTTPHRPPKNAAVGAGDATPTPSRFRDALGTPSRSEDLTSSAMKVFSSSPTKVHPDTVQALKSLLDKHSVQFRSIEKGRDAARSAIKSRNAEILTLKNELATLQRRIDVQESELESGKAMTEHLREELRLERQR